jgi:hypothetical protein
MKWNVAFCRSQPLLTLISLLFVCCRLAAAQDNNAVPFLSSTYLELETKQVGQQGTIAFTRAYPEDTPSPLPNERDSLRGYSNDNAYEFIVDRQSITFDSWGKYTFNVYAVLQEGQNRGIGILMFYITASPRGAFSDQEDTVKFHLHRGNAESVGLVSLPLHSIGTNDLLELVIANPAVQTVKVSRPQLTLKLRSALPDFPLQILDVEVTKEDCPECWRGSLTVPTDLQRGRVGRILANKGQDTELVVNGSLNRWAALLTSSTHFSLSDPHDRLTLRASYAPAEGGRVRTQDFSIPVRFSPSIWDVIVALVLGWLLGVAIRKAGGQADIVPSRNQWKQWKLWTPLATTAAAVVVSEGVLYATVSADSRPLVLFGINVDPTQPLTIFLIALIVSGGPTVTTWFNNVIKQLWDSIKSTQPASAKPKEGN